MLPGQFSAADQQQFRLIINPIHAIAPIGNDDFRQDHPYARRSSKLINLQALRLMRRSYL